MSTTYGLLYGLRQTGIRFFTVYGPHGRPDMAYFLFTRKLFSGEAIEVYGEGKLLRDFTYIDDAVDGLIAVLDRPPEAGENRILNLGNSKPEKLLDFINIIERATGKKANIMFRPMSPGDVTATWADISRIQALVGFKPKVEISEGLPRFVDWYRTRYLRA
jgi:UDP-glucuronate 4-epimerase